MEMIAFRQGKMRSKCWLLASCQAISSIAKALVKDKNSRKDKMYSYTQSPLQDRVEIRHEMSYYLSSRRLEMLGKHMSTVGPQVVR
ncbi:hypothetical protein Plhal304r1_c096g0173651 [Plasmopara halstedii]